VTSETGQQHQDALASSGMATSVGQSHRENSRTMSSCHCYHPELSCDACQQLFGKLSQVSNTSWLQRAMVLTPASPPSLSLCESLRRCMISPGIRRRLAVAPKKSRGRRNIRQGYILGFLHKDAKGRSREANDHGHD
jgi:hypothetical protein